MGLVYLGVDTRLNRQVAIKCLRSELYESHYIERFKREAFLLAKLNHPNIVQIYDFIETPEQLALVMEFVDGQNLQQHLRENIVPYARRMRWLSQIAQGLAVAHDEGIIHRDLKAENILVNRRGEVRISDLGIAKSQDFNATLTDHVAGSYCSMSPEQALGETLDFKSDLFSFGILAYQLLCGVHPFGATDNKLQLMQRIISHPPASPMQHNPSLPVEICDLLGQLLSKDPARRPDSSHWLAAQWEALSLIPIAQEFAADNTLALPRSAESGAQKNHPSGEHLTYSQAGAGRPAYNPETDSYSHHTFDTRFVERARPHQSLGRRLVNYARAKSVTLSLSLLTLVILAGLLVWQLQPKPPKYIAVLPPKITAANLSDRQQVLVSAAVYDAIQQSLLGLDNYYLIPRTDIEDANGDTDIVRRATAADELISADIRCKDEVCHIALARLTPENSNSSSRLRVADSRSLDVLADNYLAIAEVVERSTSSIYLSKSQNIFENVQAQDYDALLDITRLYRDQGANDLLLDKLDAMRGALRSMQTTRSLYTDIALDLNYETEELAYLTRLERFLQQSATPDDAADLRNIYYLQIAQAKFNDAQQTLEKIAALSANDSYLFALRAYGKMAEKDYPAAIALYEKSLAIKTTATNLYYQAVAFWYSGDNDQAKARLNASLKISPGLYLSLIHI